MVSDEIETLISTFTKRGIKAHTRWRWTHRRARLDLNRCRRANNSDSATTTA